VRVEDGKLAEHWDVLQDEATKGRIRQWAADVRRPLPRLTFAVPQEAPQAFAEAIVNVAES